MLRLGLTGGIGSGKSTVAKMLVGQGATLISALWGLFYWREFKNPSPKVKQLLALMLVLFAVGLALVSIAPLRK